MCAFNLACLLHNSRCEPFPCFFPLSPGWTPRFSLTTLVPRASCYTRPMDLRPRFLHLYLGMESQGCRAVCSSQHYLHHGCSGLSSTATRSPTSPHFHLTLTLGFIQLSLACLQDCLSSLLLCSKLPQTAWLGIICIFLPPIFCGPGVWVWLSRVSCSARNQGIGQAAFSSAAQRDRELPPSCLRLLAEFISLWLYDTQPGVTLSSSGPPAILCHVNFFKGSNGERVSVMSTNKILPRDKDRDNRGVASHHP